MKTDLNEKDVDAIRKGLKDKGLRRPDCALQRLSVAGAQGLSTRPPGLGRDKQSAPSGSFRLQEWIYGPYAALKFDFLTRS